MLHFTNVSLGQNTGFQISIWIESALCVSRWVYIMVIGYLAKDKSWFYGHIGKWSVGVGWRDMLLMSDFFPWPLHHGMENVVCSVSFSEVYLYTVYFLVGLSSRMPIVWCPHSLPSSTWFFKRDDIRSLATQ